MTIKKLWPLLLAVVMVFGFIVSCGDDDAPPAGEPTVVWQPAITASTPMQNSGEYIGSTGIQRAVGASELTLTPIANGFTMTLVSGTYKPINIQVGTAAGGTNYYTNPDGFNAVTGTAYTLSFNASVTSGTGQLRIVANGADFSSPQNESLTTTPKAVTFSWTQGSGNLKLDTGSTATGGVITITGIKITTP